MYFVSHTFATMSFHRNCGKRITLSNNNTTATRSFNEFNHGLVLSAAPLEDNVLFEVRIDQKVLLIFPDLETKEKNTKLSTELNECGFVGIVVEWQYRDRCHIGTSGN